MTTAHLAWALGTMGYNVVVLDWDPQAAQTRIFKYPIEEMSVSPVYEILTRQEPPQQIMPYLWRYKGFRMSGSVHLLPNSTDMYAYIPKILDSMTIGGGTTPYEDLKKLLVKPLESLGTDYLLIDGEPGCSVLGIMSVAAADYIIIPSIPDFISTQALYSTLHVMFTILNPWVNRQKILGVLPVMVPGYLTKHVRQWAGGMTDVINEFEVPIYAAFINDSTEYREALAQGVPIWIAFPRNRGANAYKEVARETVEAIRGREHV